MVEDVIEGMRSMSERLESSEVKFAQVHQSGFARLHISFNLRSPGRVTFYATHMTRLKVVKYSEPAFYSIL
jgi:hypothetical protein